MTKRTRERTTNITLPGRFFEPYVPESEPIASYLERVDLFLKVSRVTQDKTVPVFLSAMVE